MTAPIPIEPVSIHPQFVPQQGTPGVELLLSALEHRQQLDIAQKKLEQDQQQFELSKRIGASTIAHGDAETARIRQEMKQREGQLAASDHALQIVSGNLMRLGDTNAWGKILTEAPDAMTRAAIVDYRDKLLNTAQTAANTRNTAASAVRTETANTTDAEVAATLKKYAGRLGDPQQQARAIGDIAAIDPQSASQLASALNVGNGRFQHVLAVTGEPYSFDSKTGRWVRQSGNLGAKATALMPQEAQAVAQQGHSIVARMEELLHAHPDADAPTLAAQGARNVKGHGLIGAAIGTLEPTLLSPWQAEFNQLADNLLHLQGSLLPRGQRSMPIMENLRSSFIAPGGSAQPARSSARRTRLDIDRTFFIPIGKGQQVDMRRFPGWTQAAQAALGEQTAPAAPGSAPNLDEWRQGTPP